MATLSSMRACIFNSDYNKCIRAIIVSRWMIQHARHPGVGVGLEIGIGNPR